VIVEIRLSLSFFCLAARFLYELKARIIKIVRVSE
jgi:hypothetical protein